LSRGPPRLTTQSTLNRKKSTEIVFVDTRRRRQAAASPPMPGIPRVTSIKVLGVTVTNGLSASDHVRGVITTCSQTLYALRVLRAHGMCDSALQTIFRSVVVAKLLYACSAWWGFVNATDRQRVNAFLRRSIRCGYCPPDLPPFEELCQEVDQQLFDAILTNSNHLTTYFIDYFLRSLKRRRTTASVPAHTIGN